MKKNLFLCLSILFAIPVVAQMYPSQGISLLGHWDDTTITPNSSWVHSRYSSVIGYVDSTTGHEYAIIGSQRGTHIIDLADPTNPVLADSVPGRRADCEWREYKTYSHYLYMVSDDASPNSLQIADLSYLPDSVHVVYDSNSLIERSHTIFIDGDKMYCGIVHRFPAAYPMAVYSLANPELPVFLRSLNTDYPNISVVHDMFVKNDTIYASCGLQGLYLFTYNANNTFSAMDSFMTANTNYNHSGYLSSDGNTYYFAEEVPTGRPLYAMDVSDPYNITTISTFYSHQGATPHNPYVKGDRLFVASYQEGLQVFDISDPQNVTVAGYFDTFPFDTAGYLSPDYQGAWGAYPYLPSGHILVSDMQSGLFVLDADSISGIEHLSNTSLKISVFPVPAREEIHVELSGWKHNDAIHIEVCDLTGRILMSRIVQPGPVHKMETFATSQLSAGIYLLRAATVTGSCSGVIKFIRY
jgi:choice-of-anchor B domain-containing protein